MASGLRAQVPGITVRALIKQEHEKLDGFWGSIGVDHCRETRFVL